jgi:hypothetical protein
LNRLISTLLIYGLISSCKNVKENQNKKIYEEKLAEQKLKREQELNQKPLKIYLNGWNFGYGAIIYVESQGQVGNQLFLDENNIGVTTYPFSSLIKQKNSEFKYQWFRIIGNDTIPMTIFGKDDSLAISSSIPVSLSSSEMDAAYSYIQFYSGKYPDDPEPEGVHVDSTEFGRWENLIESRLIELYKRGIRPQKNH